METDNLPIDRGWAWVILFGKYPLHLDSNYSTENLNEADI